MRTVRAPFDLETVALDDAGITAPLAGTDGIDPLASLEDIDLDLGARLELGRFFRGQARFGEVSPGRAAAVLIEMSALGLGEEIRAAIAVCELNGVVAILLRRLLLDHRIRTRFEDGHGHGSTRFGKDLGHTEFLAK